MKKTIYSLSLLILLIGSLNAQINNNPNNPSDPNNPNGNGTGSGRPPIAFSNAVQKFKSSDFMVRFSDFKTQMETDVRDFIGRQNSYSVKDVRRVQMSYDKTAAKFNTIMLEIKQDFMDKEKVKMINKFPDMYANGLKGKIDGLEDFYRANFNQTLESVTEGGSSALLLVLVDLIKMAGELSQHFKSLKFEKEYMNDQYLQQNLVDPYKLPTWSQLLVNTPIKTDVRIHPSRQNNPIDPNNGGGINNGGGNNNGGGTDNGGGNIGDPNNSGTPRVPKNTTENHAEKGVELNENAPQNNSSIEVEGKSTIKTNTEGLKKRPKPNTPN